ncbi:MAG: hypothetical protein HY722_11630 [Planctomycetes bacterium]|nr:hypothetical protein [Planctomycetota bacterium]
MRAMGMAGRVGLALALAALAGCSTPGRSYGRKSRHLMGPISEVARLEQEFMRLALDENRFRVAEGGERADIWRGYVLQKEVFMGQIAEQLGLFGERWVPYRDRVTDAERLATESFRMLEAFHTSGQGVLEEWEVWHSARRPEDPLDALLTDEESFRQVNDAFKSLLFIGSTPLSQVEAVVAQDIRVLDGEE